MTSGTQRWLLLPVALAIVVSLWAERSYADTTLLERQFERVVFGREIGRSSGPEILSRWEQTTIHVAWTAFETKGEGDLKPVPPPNDLRAISTDHFATLSRLTGRLFVSALEASVAPDLTIIFTDTGGIARVPLPGIPTALQAELAAPNRCYFVIKTNASGSITRGFIVVNQDLSLAKIDHCLLEEAVQALGAKNDSPLIRPSIFSDHDRLVQLTLSDQTVLKVLYHPDLKAGLPLDQAMVLARPLLQEFRIKGNGQ